MDSGEQEKVEGLFFSSLLLVGFPVSSATALHSIQFSSDMFRSPNVKGMEVVVHFLLLQLSPTAAQEAFRGVWPIHSKQQAYDFKKRACTLMQAMEQEGPAELLPPNTCRLSHLQTCAGPRFVRMLWLLSTLALHRALQQRHPTDLPYCPTLPATHLHLYPLLVSATKVHISERCARFLPLAQRSVSMQHKWEECDDHIAVRLQNANEALQSLSEQEQFLLRKHAEFDEQQSEEWTMGSRQAWEHIRQHDRDVQRMSPTIHGIIHQRNNPFELHIHQLACNPPVLPHSKQNQSLSLYRDEKLDLVSVIHLWITCMKNVIQELTMGNVKPRQTEDKILSTCCAWAETMLKEHADQLLSFQSLHHELATLLTTIQDSIGTLQNFKRVEAVQLQSPTSSPHTLLPPTPASFMKIPSPVKAPARVHPQGLDPVMVQKLQSSIRRVAVSGPHTKRAVEHFSLGQ